MTRRAEFEAVMNRIKNLTEYEVQITVPEDFQFEGPVPYDMSISGDTAWVKVVAASLEEATIKANEYFECKYK
jgi:hypothetical protein